MKECKNCIYKKATCGATNKNGSCQKFRPVGMWLDGLS
jgi:hypothetical protein